MPFLRAVVMEALRLYPPVPLLYRKPVAQSVFENEQVTRKTTFLVGVYSVNRDRGYWGDDADEFNPERWESPVLSTVDTKYMYMSFSQGPRSCIGKYFALASMKCILVTLVDRFSFDEINPGTHPKLLKGVFLKPQTGFKLRLTRCPPVEI